SARNGFLALELRSILNASLNSVGNAMNTPSTPNLMAAGSAFITDDQRWAAVQVRNRAADGHFVYAVRTTGVYGRPSSSARLPKRENVEFFETSSAAEAAGYRASRRAVGDQTAAAAQRASLVARACRLIEMS